MESLKVKIYVPSLVALAAGVARHGEGEYAPSDAELAELSTEERCALATYLVDKYNTNSLTLDAPSVDWATIARALRAKVAEKQAEKERAEKIRAETVRRAKATPIENISSSPYLYEIQSWPELEALKSAWLAWKKQSRDATVAEIKADPRLLKSLWSTDYEFATLHHEWPELIDVIETRRAEQKREKEAASAAESSAKKLALQGAKTYALDTEELSRAAEGDYDVASAVADHVAEAIARAFEDDIRFHLPSTELSAIVLREGAPEYERAAWEERKAPRKAAFDALDRVNAFVEKMVKPAGFDVNVLRVQRFDPGVDDDYDTRDDRPSKFTAVIVVIESPATKDRVVVLPAE
jgi:hypothetical protein